MPPWTWLLLSSLPLAAAAAEEPAPPAPHRAEVAGHTLTLTQRDDYCAVRMDDAEPQVLGLGLPCAFSRGRAEPVQRARNARLGSESLLVLHQGVFAPTGECAMHAQAVRIRDGRLEVSSVSGPMAMCSEGPTDDKMLHGLYAD